MKMRMVTVTLVAMVAMVMMGRKIFSDSVYHTNSQSPQQLLWQKEYSTVQPPGWPRQRTCHVTRLASVHTFPCRLTCGLMSSHYFPPGAHGPRCATRLLSKKATLPHCTTRSRLHLAMTLHEAIRFLPWPHSTSKICPLRHHSIRSNCPLVEGTGGWEDHGKEQMAKNTWRAWRAQNQWTLKAA